MRLTCSNCKYNDSGFCNAQLNFTVLLFEQYCKDFEKKDGDDDVRFEEQGNAAM